MALSPKWYQFLVGVFASLGSLLYGYDLGVIAQVIASQSFKTKFHPSNNEEYVFRHNKVPIRLLTWPTEQQSCPFLQAAPSLVPLPPVPWETNLAVVGQFC